MGTKLFDIVTLTLKFDLLLKNFNLGDSFLTWRGRAFYYICTFLVTSPFYGYQTFWQWPWPWSLTYFQKFLTLGKASLPDRKAFKVHMCIPSSKIFNAVPWWPWSCRLTVFFFKLSWTMTFESEGLLFTYGCGRPAMLSFWQLWFLVRHDYRPENYCHSPGVVGGGSVVVVVVVVRRQKL